jgi:ribosomal protein L11 methyltransferase
VTRYVRTYASVGFQVPSDKADDAAGILVAYGSLGCEVRKVARRAGAATHGKPRVLLRAYFDQITAATLKRLQSKLQAAQILADGSAPEQQEIEDPGWATMWQARFAPLRIGRKFLIVPPWQTDRDPKRITLIIRPGQAFGTAHHPSTAGTLKVLEQICVDHQIGHALDVGTGSGILAIAMIKLGVGDVAAIDIDRTALENARANAKINQVAGRIRFSSTPLDAVRGVFGLIAANILSSTLIQMAPDLMARLRNHGHLALAGILQREAQSVADAYTDLCCVGWKDEGAWTTLIFEKR